MQAAINGSLCELPAADALPSHLSQGQQRRLSHPDPGRQLGHALSPAQIYDAADAILAQRLSQVEGVAQVNVRGAGKPAIRITRRSRPGWPSMGLGTEDVRKIIAQSTVNQPKGNFDGASESLSIATNDQLTRPADYEPLIVRAANGAIVRLSDVGSVVDGAENARLAGWYNRDSAVLLMVTKQPGANIIETVDRIHAHAAPAREMAPRGHQGFGAARPHRTASAPTSTRCELTLLLSLILVIGVVYASLGGLAPTLAASVAAPLSLAATFAVMWLLDYSLDNITLMALTISTGFVVDDAIVMIENISRRMERGTAAADGRHRRRPRDVVHHHLHKPVAGRGLHPGAVPGRNARADSARVLRHPLCRDPGVHRGVAHGDAHGLRAIVHAAPAQAPDGASRRRPTLLARLGGSRHGPGAVRLYERARLGAAPSAADPARRRRGVRRSPFSFTGPCPRAFSRPWTPE